MSQQSLIPKGRPPAGDRPLTSAERVRAHRAKRKQQGWSDVSVCPLELAALVIFRSDPTVLDQFIEDHSHIVEPTAD